MVVKIGKSSRRVFESLIAGGIVLILLTGIIYILRLNQSVSSHSLNWYDKDKKNKKSDGGKKGGSEPGNAHFFEGGRFEMSGVIGVPGTNGILLVDDGNPSVVLWARLDKQGRQIGSVQPIALGASIDDPEGITSDGTYYYIVGSQSKTPFSGQPGIVRFRFDGQTQRVSDVAVASGLREFLLERIPELRNATLAEGGGLDIEGIGYDPARKHLLLGLRAPLAGLQALVLPIKLREEQGAFTTANMDLSPSDVIRLSLGNQGIRDIQYDPRLKSFLIVSGAPRELKKTDFGVWEWDGTPGTGQVRNRATLDKELQPEGITPLKIEGNEFIFVACDRSKYLKLDY